MSDDEANRFTARAAATNFTLRGEAVDEFSGAVRFTNELYVVTEARARRGAGVGTAGEVRIDGAGGATLAQDGKKLADIEKSEIRGYLARPGCFVWVALRDARQNDDERKETEDTVSRFLMAFTTIDPLSGAWLRFDHVRAEGKRVGMAAREEMNLRQLEGQHRVVLENPAQ